MKKTVGLIFTAAGTVAAIAALVLYLFSGTTMIYVLALAIAAVALGAVSTVAYGVVSSNKIFSLLIPAAGVLIIGAAAWSLVTEVELLGYLVSGLRQWKDVAFWAYFTVASVISWLLYMVASFLQPKQG